MRDRFWSPARQGDPPGRRKPFFDGRANQCRLVTNSIEQEPDPAAMRTTRTPHEIRTTATRIVLAAAACTVLMAGCAVNRFAPASPDQAGFIERGITQQDGDVIVTAAVPSPGEVESLFGIDLYKDGIQPVWLEVENRGDQRARILPYSIDRDYYSPLEIAWAYRKKFASSSRDAMERWFYDNALDHRVPPGEKRSGFVFTHAIEGTKGFNLDIYSDNQSRQFTFFVPVPGFRPDYMDVDFQNLYAEDQIGRVDFPSLSDYLESMPCCTSDAEGVAAGDPLNVVIVGTPEAVRRTLLRGRWQETQSGSPVTRLARRHYFNGRQPDGTFHKSRPDGRERKELRLWLAPVLVDGLTTWIGHVSYDMSGKSLIRDLSDYQIDPDVDDARTFLVQNFWYNQSLRGLSMVEGIAPNSIESPRVNFLGGEYFTDGQRVVLWVSEDPVGMDETDLLMGWEPEKDD
jgi:hypothetical protein